MKNRTLFHKTRWAAYLAVAMIGLSIVSTYVNYSSTIYAADRAVGWFSRAEAAAFAEDMIEYIREGRKLLPASGNPVWWFPTQRTDFALIQRDIDALLQRAEIIRTLSRGSTAYQQGMDDLRGKIHAMEDQIGDAAPFMFAAPLSIVLSGMWSIMEAFLILSYFRGRTNDGENP